MFVAGLNLSISQTRDRSASILSAASSSRRGSLSKPSTSSQHLSAASSVGLSLSSPLTSPGPSARVPLPSSPPVYDAEGGGQFVERDEKDKEFDDLVDNLRGAFVGGGGKGQVWLSQSERKDFRIVLVDKVSYEFTDIR
jgi:hypothetical protein